MAKLTSEQIRAELTNLEQRLRAGEKLSTHDFEAAIKAAGSSYKEAQRQIEKHGSPYLLGKYVESFGNHCPMELKKYQR